MTVLPLRASSAPRRVWRAYRGEGLGAPRTASTLATTRRIGPDLLFPDCAPSSVRPSASQRALVAGLLSG